MSIIDKAVANPYAPPKASLEPSSHGCWRDGKALVVPKGQALPDRCIKCNDPAVKDKPRTFSWHHPGYYILLPLAILLYVIVASIASKKVKLAVGLCEAHRQRRRTLRFTALGLFLVGCAGVFCAIDFENELSGLAGGLAFLAAVIVALVAGSSLTPNRIKATEARFRGCGKAFLDSLPQR